MRDLGSSGMGVLLGLGNWLGLVDDVDLVLALWGHDYSFDDLWLGRLSFLGI